VFECEDGTFTICAWTYRSFKTLRRRLKSEVDVVLALATLERED
jgi:hypothetical protein